MSEQEFNRPNQEEFPVDGSDLGDPTYNSRNPLSESSDSARRAALQEVEDELNHPDGLLDTSTSQIVEAVRSAANGLYEEERREPPRHDILEIQKEKTSETSGLISTHRSPRNIYEKGSGSFIDSNFDVIHQTQLDILGVLSNNAHKSEREILDAIYERNKISPDSPARANIRGRVHRALTTGALKSTLAVDQFEKYYVSSVAGGMDAQRPQDVDTIETPAVSKASFVNRIKEKLADGADIVEDGINRGLDSLRLDVVAKEETLNDRSEPSSVDQSGAGFLSQFGVSAPDASNYATSAKVYNDLNFNTPPHPKETQSESPARQKFVTTLNNIIEKVSGSVKNKLKVFSEFKAHESFERILSNLPYIEGFVPSDEYAMLVRIAEQGVEENNPVIETAEPQTIPFQVPKKVHNEVQIRPSIVNHAVVDVAQGLKERGISPPPPVYIPKPAPERTLNERVSEAVLGAQGVSGISQNAVEQLSTTRHLEPIGPITKEDFETKKEQLKKEVVASLKSFAQQESLRKQNLNKKKELYEKVMSELGVPGKQRPDAEDDITQDYIDAKKAYIDASRELRHFVAHKDILEDVTYTRAHEYSILEQEKVRRIDVGVMEQTADERDLLIRLVKEATPPKERGIIMKGLEKWARVPLRYRIALSATLFSLASGGIGGVAAVASRRAFQGIVGVEAAKIIGSKFDGVRRKKAEEKKKEALKDFATIDTIDDDKKLEFLEESEFEAENQEKRDRATKIALMAAAGGATSIATGVGINAIHDTFVAPGGTTSPDIGVTSEPKGSWLDKFIKKEVVVEEPVAPKAPSVVEKVIETAPQKIYVTPVEVELSKNGFIETVDKLKQATAGQKLTPALEKLFAQSPQKIAIDLGLFKPGQAAESAFGFHGEQLTIDAEGNVSLMHNTGETEVLMNSQGTLKPYSGKMFDADGAPVSEVPKVTPEPLRAAAPVIETPPPVKTAIPDVRPEMGIKAGVSTESLAADSATVASSLVEVNQSPIKMETSLRYNENHQVKALLVNDIEIATPLPGFKNPQDILSGKMPLKSDLQFGSDGKIRTEYNKFFTKTLALMSDAERAQLFDYHLPVQYKGGRIDIFQKGEDITVLLNGEKILSATMVDGKPGYLFERPEAKSIFSVKSEYEIASDEAKNAIEKNIKFFNVKK